MNSHLYSRELYYESLYLTMSEIHHNFTKVIICTCGLELTVWYSIITITVFRCVTSLTTVIFIIMTITLFRYVCCLHPDWCQHMYMYFTHWIYSRVLTAHLTNMYTVQWGINGSIGIQAELTVCRIFTYLCTIFINNIHIFIVLMSSSVTIVLCSCIVCKSLSVSPIQGRWFPPC